MHLKPTSRSFLAMRLLTFAVIASCAYATARAQSKDGAEAKQPETHTQDGNTQCRSASPCTLQVYKIRNISAQNDANEVLVALRNVLEPWVKIYLVASQNQIVLWASPDQQEVAARLIQQLDHPHTTYRVTFTLTEMDGSKRLGTQHYSMVVQAGKRTMLKEGSKVPVATGTVTQATSASQTQFTYLDVGMNFDVTLDPYGDGVHLKSKVERSSALDERVIAGIHEPVVRQTVLEGEFAVPEGKPALIGSIDIDGTTRRDDVTVLVEPTH